MPNDNQWDDYMYIHRQHSSFDRIYFFYKKKKRQRSNKIRNQSSKYIISSSKNPPTLSCILKLITYIFSYT